MRLPLGYFLLLAIAAGCVTADFSDLELALAGQTLLLRQGAPIFGDYQNSQINTSTWMKAYADSTLIVHMNLPGVHDAATWNYSQSTQDALNSVTTVAGITEFPAQFSRCQESSMIQALNAGVRVFDLRYALDPANKTLVFWHSRALLSDTATLVDVLFGFGKWLVDHPSEAVFISLMYESNTTPSASNNDQVQTLLFAILNSAQIGSYINQAHDQFGSLGEARGKLTLLKRFDLSDSTSSNALPGVHFSPGQWMDNSPAFSLAYSSSGTAYIEDYYSVNIPVGAGSPEAIKWKLNATTAHLDLAASNTHPNDLFWTFASGENDVNSPSTDPENMAVGNGTADMPGVNQQLVNYFNSKSSKTRLGIVMFDYYDSPNTLINSLLKLQQPH